jgi:hypothetical protein
MTVGSSNDEVGVTMRGERRVNRVERVVMEEGMNGMVGNGEKNGDQLRPKLVNEEAL